MKTIIIAISFALAAALSNAAPPSSAVTPQAQSLPDRKPLVIAPMIEHVFLCEEGANNPSIKSFVEAVNWCIKNRKDSSSRISRALDELETGGAKGKVQLGYLSTLQLLSLFEKKSGKWIINKQKVDLYLRLIEKIDRPVVIYLAADHFDTQGPLSEELKQNPDNMLVLNDGNPPISEYFGYSIIPYTLLTDESIPVNRYRFEALRYVAKRITNLSEAARNRIVAITLAGELHHMFPDFENGMGYSDRPQVTDYSQRSIVGFRSYLKKKYISIGSLNKSLGTSFVGFDNIPAPAKNIRSGRTVSLSEHYDPYAGGMIPISGWLWDPQKNISQINIYIDEKDIGLAEHNLNRLDVYRAVEEITTPNVGFMYQLDYRSLPRGQHLIQVVASANGKKYLIGQSEIVVGSPWRNKIWRTKLDNRALKLEPITNLPQVKSWLDMPKQKLDFYYNPLAREWDDYRSLQVKDFLHRFWQIARDSGLPESKLFSHQILPRTNPTWNEQLFAVDESVAKGVPWKFGINLYGGATNNDQLTRFLAERNITDYGVPEFNPQQWKNSQAAYDALKAQYVNGARFVSPYYLSIIPDRFRATDAHSLNRMEIRPDNKSEGSDHLHEAIRLFVVQ